MLALALPAAASDYTLGIFGNANEDDTINMQDVTYTELIILEYRDETELSDAKYDGKINMQDVTQIELVILGREKELTIVDSAEMTVTVKKPVERVVCCHSNIIETMRSIGVTDTIVGVDDKTIENKEFFPEFSEIPSIGGWTPDIEAILELQPDVVFVYPVSGVPVVEKLEPIGIPVVCIDCYKPQSYVEEIEKLGYILEKREETREFLDFYQGYMNTIEEQVEGISETDKPRVYLGWKFDPYKTGGLKSGYHWKIVAAGGTNIFGDLEPMYPVVDSEEIIERDPEIIVWSSKLGGYLLDVGDTSELETLREEIMSRPELQEVTAVKNENVYVITNHILGGTRNFVSIGYMAKWLHPDIFEDLEPSAIHQEYLTEFQGLDYDLSEHGVFVYPPLEES